MIAQVHAAALVGIDAIPVTVEVDIRPSSVPNFLVVGLADRAIEESKVRLRSAIANSELSFPSAMIVCNLAPADLRKDGTGFDLAIAVAVLAAHGSVAPESLEGTMVLGELGLDGRLRPIFGAVSVALTAAQHGFKRLILPEANADEAAVATGVEVYGMGDLLDVVQFLNGAGGYAPTKLSLPGNGVEPVYDVDFADVKGQRHAVRALEIAAAGGHNVLMVGPPGSGKTMLARRLPTILPPLTLEEAIAVTRVYSSAGAREGKRGLMFERPFRSPHHSASYAALVGGGKVPKPGEISLGHKGVLFLDEMPEFDRAVLEALREPLEDGHVTVSRVQATLVFPAECILVGAMNPCPCGYRGYPEQKCVSNPAMCVRYAQRISGPLLDRIDLHLDVPRLKPEELLGAPTGESSDVIRRRVQQARAAQHARLGGSRVNALMTPREIREQVSLTPESQAFLKMVASRMNLSGRVFDRILKVSRTIADLAGSAAVEKVHLAEAVQYRERTEMWG
ncbi:MAG: YifB family Mg chelatase-like AAA ATPase [Fimbriimonadaceae bacterium]